VQASAEGSGDVEGEMSDTPKLADGTAPGTTKVIGQRCTVWLPDRLGKEGTPGRVIRFGRVLGTELLQGVAMVKVGLPWGDVRTVPACDVEVFE
jgi:hypothetical protein